jgi:hypothetical protein
MHFAGQPYARLSNDQSVYLSVQKMADDGTPRRSLLITICSPLRKLAQALIHKAGLTIIAVYFAPDVHLTSLELIWTDRWINKVPWKKLMSKVQDEWREYVVFSTILREPTSF